MHEITLKLPRKVRGLMALDAAGVALARAEREGASAAAKQQEAAALAQREAQQREAERVRQQAAELRQLSARLETLAEELLAARQAFLRDTPAAVVELSLAIAERLVPVKFSQDAGAVDAAVRGVLERLGQRDGVAVYLNPDDLAALQRTRLVERDAAGTDGAAGPLTGRPNDAAALRWVADAALSRGDCRVEAGELTLRANWREQLQRLGADLLREAADSSGSGKA